MSLADEIFKETMREKLQMMDIIDHVRHDVIIVGPGGLGKTVAEHVARAKDNGCIHNILIIDEMKDIDDACMNMVRGKLEKIELLKPLIITEVKHGFFTNPNSRRERRKKLRKNKNKKR